MQHNFFSKPSGVTKELRDYQDNAVIAIFDYFAEYHGSPIIVIPTAGGKSLIIAEFMRQANEYFNGTRFVVMAHVSELLTQNAEELMNQWNEAHISFFSDSLGQKSLDGDIIFAGIQSIYKKAYDFRRVPDIILVDECHLIPPDNDTMYRKFIDEMLTINPDIKIVGFTATPFRAGYGYLHKGKNALFTHIAYEIPITDLIARGHLCPIVTPSGGVKTKMDVKDVKTTKGDYVQKQLSKAVDDAAITSACVDELVAYGEDRKSWLVFTVDIEHCTHVRDEIRKRGISCEMVHSKTPQMERNAIVDRYKRGEVRCLVNVAVFTTGFNNPAIDLMAFMRPTRSPVLYIQMAGRGMRIFPGKSNCLLLDFGGVVEELGPIDQVRVPEKGDGTGEAPMKYCPGEVPPDGNICNVMVHAAVMKCPHCGYDFPENGLNLDTTASSAAVLSSQMKPKILEVKKVAYYRHKKEGKPDTMRVDYLCGFDTFKEWVCFEHARFPREKACAWWRQRSTTPPPNTITDALARAIKELRVPTRIHVKKVGKYHEIVGAEFGDRPVEVEEVEDIIPEEIIYTQEVNEDNYIGDD